MEPIVAAINEFSVKVFKSLYEDKQENVVFSPFSISSALTMVYFGAGGNTEVQMAKVLNFKKATEKTSCAHTKEQNTGAAHLQNIPQAFKELFLHINKPSNKYILKSANALYYEKSFRIVKKYAQLIEKSFHATIESVNFVQGAEESRKQINDWVEEKTEGKIKDILAQGSVDPLTKLVLVNALYFKGNWANKFPEANTEQRPFRLSKTKTKPVPMMFQRNKFNMLYIENLEAKVLELPYDNKEASMFIFLPDDIKDNSNGLEQLQRELTYEKLQEWTQPDMMELTEVELQLPRLYLEESFNLKPYLTKMGMSDVFDANKADLKRISEKGKIFVSQVFHKVHVEVNEEGTEAAAATAAVITVRSRAIVVTFQADHPFIFVVKENKTKAIMFMGVFTCP